METVLVSLVSFILGAFLMKWAAKHDFLNNDDDDNSDLQAW